MKFLKMIVVMAVLVTALGFGACAQHKEVMPFPTQKELRKIDSGTQQFVVGHLALKARSFFGLAFFLRTNKFCSTAPSGFTGEDMPPMICHVPCVRVHVCVIRILSVLTSAPVLFAHVALIR